MSKDSVPVDEPPDGASLVSNWEYRISMLEHEMGIQQGRMPKNKIRRMFWFIYNGLFITVPIIGGAAAIYGEDPWKTTVVAAAFAFLVGKTLVDFSSKVSQGPRPHRSILVKDHR